MIETDIIEFGTCRGFEVLPGTEKSVSVAGGGWGYAKATSTPSPLTYRGRIFYLIKNSKVPLTKSDITRIEDIESGAVSRHTDALVKSGLITMGYEPRILPTGGGGAGKGKWKQGVRKMKIYFLTANTRRV